MNRGRILISEIWRRRGDFVSIETLIAVLTVAPSVLLFLAGWQDRLLLNLYFVTIAGAAYLLVPRCALKKLAIAVTIAAAVSLVNSYWASKIGTSFPCVAIDLVCWTILVVLNWRLIVQAVRSGADKSDLHNQQRVAEQSANEMSRALTCLSHEVRTPLAAILTIAETLLEDTDGLNDDSQQELVSRVKECGEHLMNLVNNTLDYAKAEAGKIELRFDTVPLCEIVGQCVKLVEHGAVLSGIKISTLIDPSVTIIDADPVRLRQILLNLLSNAIKFSPSGGHVSVHVRNEGGVVSLSVRDVGRGISDKALPNLFDPFFQTQHDDISVGTGMGLAITKHLVELHGGAITVESYLNAGSRFTVRLPIEQPVENRQPEPVGVCGSNEPTSACESGTDQELTFA